MIVIHCLGSLKCAGWNLVPRAAWIMKIYFGVILLFSYVHWMFRGACLPSLSGLGFRAHSSMSCAWLVMLALDPLLCVVCSEVIKEQTNDWWASLCAWWGGQWEIWVLQTPWSDSAPTEDNEWPIGLGTARVPQGQHCETILVLTTQLPLLSPFLHRLLCVSFLLLNPGQKGVVQNYFRLWYSNNSTLPRRAVWTGDPVTK